MWYNTKNETHRNYSEFLDKLDPEQKAVLQRTIFARTQSGIIKEQNKPQLRYCGFVTNRDESC